jgi:uncharacterized protein (DUF302 family)
MQMALYVLGTAAAATLGLAGWLRHSGCGDERAYQLSRMNAPMTGEVGSVRYALREPFDRAVESVCGCLTNHGLQVAGHVDLAKRIERKLGIVMAPCRILFVFPSTPRSSRDAIHPWAAALLPLHVVISGNDFQTEIQVQHRILPREEAASTIFGPVIETQSKVAEALDAIAMRPSLVT